MFAVCLGLLVNGMPCPFFAPEQRLDPGPWTNPPRLPLGDPYSGSCRVRPGEFHARPNPTSATYAIAAMRVAAATDSRGNCRGRGTFSVSETAETESCA